MEYLVASRELVGEHTIQLLDQYRVGVGTYWYPYRARSATQYPP